MNRRKIAGVAVAAAVAGTGIIGSNAPASMGCVARVQLFEDGSYANGAVTLGGLAYADTFTITPLHGAAPHVVKGTLLTEWPVSARVGNLTVPCTMVVK